MEEIRIPQTLDNQPLLLIFSANQLYCLVGSAIVGIAIGHPFYCGAVGIVCGSFLNKYADKKPDGFLRHTAHFYGIPILRGKGKPSGLDREFRP
jgi:hypothetical protein